MSDSFDLVRHCDKQHPSRKFSARVRPAAVKGQSWLVHGESRPSAFSGTTQACGVLALSLSKVTAHVGVNAGNNEQNNNTFFKRNVRRRSRGEITKMLFENTFK